MLLQAEFQSDERLMSIDKIGNSEESQRGRKSFISSLLIGQKWAVIWTTHFFSVENRNHGYEKT